MLKEAYDCLNSDKNYRGRAKQKLTLISSGEKKEMEVSPHLNIYTTAWSSIPISEEDAKSKFQEAFTRLEPLYDFVKETIGDLHKEKVYPDELDKTETLFEGIKKAVLVNSYERNPTARKKCIEHYGAQCVVCGFNFEKMYGNIGFGFIHVHHLTKLSEIGQGYEVNPVKDLRPVCPNCHAMLHQKNPPHTIDELKLKIHN
jgi:predicted HNH restriction endonuclease